MSYDVNTYEGRGTFSDGEFSVPECAGVVTVRGEHFKEDVPAITFGFTTGTQIDPPRFRYVTQGNRGFATTFLVFPASFMAAIIAAVRLPNTNLIVGGGGALNGIETTNQPV
jgi:hypothetical protein